MIILFSIPQSSLRHRAAQIALLAFQISLERLDTRLRNGCNTLIVDHWIDATAFNAGRRKAAFSVTKADPGTLRLDQQLLGFGIVLQARCDLLVQAVQLLVGGLVLLGRALVQVTLARGVGAIFSVDSGDE